MVEVRDESLVKIVAIVCLTVITVTALSLGIDSAVVGVASATIGGIAGYEIGRFRRDRRDRGGESNI